MKDVGDLNQFGFRLSAVTVERQLRDVSIFIGGNDLTRRDNTVYLPSFIAELSATSVLLKRKIDYLRHDELFRKLSVSQIHNLLIHGNPNSFTDDREWHSVKQAYEFAVWGETTDAFAAFLIPYCDRLYLTYQFCNDRPPYFDVLNYIDGVETTPGDLIATIDEAVSLLIAEIDGSNFTC